MLSEGEVLRESLRTAIEARPDERGIVELLFLVSALRALTERHWIMSRSRDFGPGDFDAFVARALGRELAPLAFLKDWLGPELGVARLKVLSAAAKALSKDLVARSRSSDRPAFRAFLRGSVRAMTEICVFEESFASVRGEDVLPPSAYRAFDAFDEILGLRFETDRGMKPDLASGERLYVEGGAGVQTSYSSILSALENFALPPGGHLVDLGSGFGRVGLIAGLWREDLRFTGYEYVGHRVRVASDSAASAGHATRVRFFEQDLADPDFRIPLADAYYMYDPFCASTYERVLRQLNAYSRDHAFTVITKADAGTWLAKLQSEGAWAEAGACDLGLLRVFRSKPRLDASPLS